MKRFKSKKKINITITNLSVIVFFGTIIIFILLLTSYSRNYSDSIVDLANHKIEKVTYQFFSDLITEEVINNNVTKDILKINTNNKDEIMSVDYDLEKTYLLLTNVSQILKSSINDFEKGVIDIGLDDSYLKENKYGTYLNVPLLAGNNNIFLTNFGPKIPIHIHFTGSLLTNIKTKVTNYGLNNALLEIYIIVNIDELLTTPIVKKKLKLDYDILIAAKVINGSVPMFYGNSIEKSSSLIDTPIEK